MLIKKQSCKTKGEKVEQFEIKSDALGIINRLKKRNKQYSVYYNLKKNKYELYLTETNLKPKIYCLTFPFSEIDERMITHTLKSEIQNRNAILQEIEQQNALLMAREQKNILQKMENEIESKRNS